jgi:Carboxypeptidase regulatory-like domain/TonB dependent receptor
MKETSRWIAAAVGVLGVFCASTPASAQLVASSVRVAALASGAIRGHVQDEAGLPVAGVLVSALGSATAIDVTDRTGRFELRSLPPGPYLVRARLSGFIAPRGQIVQVLPSGNALSSIALRHVSSASIVSPPVVRAGVGLVPAAGEPSLEPPPQPDASPAQPSGGREPATDDDGLTWRIRHARRSILNDAQRVLVATDTSSGPAGLGPSRGFGRAVGSSARVATNFFVGTPFSGQLNLLTTSSFDAVQDMFAPRTFAGRSIANFVVGAPAGAGADWTVRGALTQGDLASWVVSGDYLTHAAAARHRYDMGLSYSTQRYDGGNFAALRTVTDGSRNVATLHGYDTFTVSRAVIVTYGADYARYDYLNGSGLLSPRVGATVTPAEHLRISARLSRRATAPGADEFVPPDTGIWLPPQRTFSALDVSNPLSAERAIHLDAGVERDFGPATISARAFREHVDDQLVTLFGIDEPGQPNAVLGHYFLANSGGVDAGGYSAGIKAVIASRVHGSIEYSFAQASWKPADDLKYLLLVAPSTVRAADERIHDIATSVEADVPETATRVMVLYRLNNAFAGRGPADSSGVDGRFDVQVRQSLPFLDFSSAKWEMLVTVRNFFRDATSDQSLYDELLVVHPPKRVVGGLTLRF